ncbi:MAG TPA: RNB domain-containing ribonuclease [Opitutaceae bacterium]|nr:RNB domain-containing ribonuclease [Opitutaceae bacterium]
MTSLNGRPARAVLQEIARRAMLARGLAPEFSAAALAELAAIRGPAAGDAVRDLRALPWCSIDNDDSRDLDQLSVAEATTPGATRLLVAVADVAAVVRTAGALDEHARQNTTSIYTAAEIFPMLPERLSTDLTSLNPDQDRRAIVVAMEFTSDGTLERSEVFEAMVRNRAKLAYDSVAAWLEASGPMPAAIAAVPGLADNLRLQDRMAQHLRATRHERGALSLETIHAQPVFDGNALMDLVPDRTNRAKHLIEDLMIAANGVVARYLAERGFPSLRRIVRTPRNWARIVTLAADHGSRLPAEPDARALGEFLLRARTADPERFPDLSLSVVKLIGPGEYVVEAPGGSAPGHFGLAVKDYAHSTAPNRRYPDVITQRLVKAALAGQPAPYQNGDLALLARHCTEQEDAVKKVERQVAKSAAAILLAPHVGETFEALVTGAADKGTWVRLTQPPAEGKLVGGHEGREVGQRIRVQLVYVDIERGFLDFIGLRGDGSGPQRHP